MLLISHRTIGHEVARATTDDGMELVVLRTAFGKLETVPAASVRRASHEAIMFAARMAMADAVTECKALGLDVEAIEALAREVAEAE